MYCTLYTKYRAIILKLELLCELESSFLGLAFGTVAFITGEIFH